MPGNKKTNGKTQADNIVNFAKIDGGRPASKQAFRKPDNSRSTIDAAMSGANEVDVAQMAKVAFRAENRERSTKGSLKILDRKCRKLDEQLKKVEAEQASSDLLVSVVADESKNKVNKVTVWSGRIAVGLGVALLASGPVLINAAIQESSVIDWVVENPLWGFAYGLAPLSGIIAAHSLRDTFNGDNHKRLLDRSISLAAIGCFAAWAYVFPAVFLPDISNGYGGAANPLFTTANFYRLHLGLEFFGGAAIYTTAINKLTHGATEIHRENEKVSLLDSAILKLEKRLEDATKQQSDIADYHDQFGAAQESYVSQTVAKFRAMIVVITDFKTRGTAVSRADLDTFLMNLKDGDFHA